MTDRFSFYPSKERKSKSVFYITRGLIKCENGDKKGILYDFPNEKREIFFPTEIKEQEFLFSQNCEPVFISRNTFQDISLQKYITESPDIYYVAISDRIHKKTLDSSEEKLYSFSLIENLLKRIKNIKKLGSIKFDIYRFIPNRSEDKPCLGNISNTIIFAKNKKDAIRLARNIYRKTKKIMHCSYTIDLSDIPENGRYYYGCGDIGELILGREEITGLKSSIFDLNVFRVINEFI